MIETIFIFIRLLLPDLRRVDNQLFVDNAHRVTLLEKEGNPVFVYEALIGEKWLPMGDVEVEAGQRYFWTRIVEVVRCYTGAIFLAPDPIVASVAVGVPGAELLTQERPREAKLVIPSKRRAGRENKGFIGKVKAEGKTRTRG